MCDVGIESTVMKVDLPAKQLIVYRRGGISLEAIQKVLDDIGCDLETVVISKAASTKAKGLVRCPQRPRPRTR